MIFFNYDSWEGRVFGKWVRYEDSLLYSCEQLDDKAVKAINGKIAHLAHAYITKIAEVIT